MNIVKKSKYVTLALTLAVAVGCSNTAQPPVDNDLDTEIILNHSQLTLAVDQASQLEASGDVIWESKQPNIASVDEYGLVTAKEEGSTEVIALVDGQEVASVTITVTNGQALAIKSFEDKEAEEVEADPDNNETTNEANSSEEQTKEKEEVSSSQSSDQHIPVTGISLASSEVNLEVNQTYQVKATISPADAGNKKVTWSSSNTGIATVNNNGIVTTRGSGTAVITATTEDGGKTAQTTVNVTPQQTDSVPVTGLSLNTSSINLRLNQTFQVSATISPSNATDKAVNWSSSNNNVATVNSSGRITARGNGTATITARTRDGGRTATLTVTVTTPVTGVSLNQSTLNLALNESSQLRATIAPSSASNKELTWSSSNQNVATVNNSGVVTARGNGTATITVTTKDGNRTAQATVNVNTRVSGVSLNQSSLNLNVNETSQLRATVSPSNATNKGVTWASSNTSVATVNSSGVVTARGSGTATITVTTNDGARTATAQVRVSHPTASSEEMQMLELVNQERANVGAPPLTMAADLVEVARFKSQDMIDHDYFAHTSPVYGTFGDLLSRFNISYRRAAENLAMGGSMESLHTGLMNSAGHRANILNPDLREIGIGIVRNSQGRLYITQIFVTR